MANGSHLYNSLSFWRALRAVRRRRRGRPAKGNTGVMLTIRVSPELRDSIDSAREERESREDFVRAAIARELRRRERAARRDSGN